MGLLWFMVMLPVLIDSLWTIDKSGSVLLDAYGERMVPDFGSDGGSTPLWCGRIGPSDDSGSMVSQMKRPAKSRTLLVLIPFVATGLASCGSVGRIFSGGQSAIGITSNTQAARFQPSFTTVVYSATDQTNADIYLTDLPDEAFTMTNGQPALLTGGYSGTLMHIGVFLIPKAGQTPIDYNATNTTITTIVINGQSHGQYGGGGFLLPSGTPGDATFGGPIRHATMQYIAGTGDFSDRIGFGELEGRVSARHDNDKAAIIAGAMSRLAASRTASAQPQK